MHFVNLAMDYTLGIKDNTKTTEVLENGIKRKVTEVVTSAGEFLWGNCIVKAARSIAVFFCHFLSGRIS